MPRGRDPAARVPRTCGPGFVAWEGGSDFPFSRLLFVLKFRLSFFQKGLHAFFLVLGFGYLSKENGFKFQTVTQRNLGTFLNGLLNKRYGDAAFCGYFFSQSQ